MAGLAALLGLAVLAVPAATALAASRVPVLTAIHATHHRGYDQLVFQFAGLLPAHRSARYVSRISGGGSRPPVPVVGSARLQVSFSPVSGRSHRGLAIDRPAERTYALPGLIQVVTARDHGSVVSFGVGVARREPFRIFTLAHPSRVVIDVRTPYRTVPARDYFLDSGRLAAGHPPLTRPVGRRVISSAAPFRALQRLFAGPTQAERARGLRFVASGATGFSDLTIRGGVARVSLVGGCRSAGSAITVASEIMPTLRQFPSVRWVKIYDPAGRTGRPGGQSDSTPACLEPPAGQPTGVKGILIIALIIVAGLGILLGLVLSMISIIGGPAQRPNIITPSAYRDERIKAKPVKTGQFPPDTAWPFYPFRQARADLAGIEADRRARYRKLWKWPFNAAVWILLLPVSVAAVACLAVAGLTTLVVVGLYVLVTWICVAVSATAFTATAAALLGAEKSWHTVMRAEASCPRCYHVTPRPAYRCLGCQKLHRDIRPGRLGLFYRRCECGTPLPTMVLRAARRLEAVCQRCGEPLVPGSAALRDVRIPIFGDISAGKTRFLYAALDSLIDTTSRAGIKVSFPDESSKSEAALALDVIRSGRDTLKTSFILPTALTCRVGTGARSTLVHLFDAAGEYYQGAQLHDSLGFLDHGHGLVYVLDPFSVGSARDRMTRHNAAAVSLDHAAVGDTEIAYGEVVSRLRDSGVEAGGQRLAVVISKADLLKIGGLELPDESDALADWLNQMGIHNLVLSARRDFAEVRYFAVASLAAAQSEGSDDPGAPLRWLLSSRGMRLPAGPPVARDQRAPDAGGGRDAGDGAAMDAGDGSGPDLSDAPGSHTRVNSAQDEIAEAHP